VSGFYINMSGDQLTFLSTCLLITVPIFIIMNFNLCCFITLIPNNVTAKEF
jgi:hypothetical protein